MSPVFMTSYAVLWVVVLLLGYRAMMAPRPFDPMVMGLHRSDHGMPAGRVFPALHPGVKPEETIEPDHRSPLGSVIIMTIPGCKACAELYPFLPAFAKENPEMKRVILSFIPEGMGADPVPAEVGFSQIRMDRNDLSTFETEFFPFGYCLSPDGKILRKGVVNNRAHLRALTGR